MAFREFNGTLDGEQPKSFREFNGELDAETGVLDKAKNAASSALDVISKGIASNSSGSVMDNAPKSDGTMSAARAGIRFDGNGLSTISDRAMDIGVDRAIARSAAQKVAKGDVPSVDTEPDTMAATSQFLQGSTSPRIADQEAVTRKPEQSLDNAIQAASKIESGYTGIGIKDYLISGAKGIESLAQLPFTAGKVAENFLIGEKAASSVPVFDPYINTINELNKWLDSGHSKNWKEEEAKQFLSKDMQSTLDDGVANAPGKLLYNVLQNPVFGEGIKSPHKILGSVLESLPSSVGSMLPVMRGARSAYEAKIALGLGEKAATKAAERAAAIGGAASEGIVGGLQQWQQTYDQVMEMPEEVRAQSPAYQKALQEAGGDKRRALQHIATNAANVAGATAAVTDAVFGGLGDRYLGSAAAGKGTRAGAVGRGIIQETPTETIQSMGEQFGTNLGVQQYANPNQKLNEGVMEQGAAGGITGGVMGGGMGGATHVNRLGASDFGKALNSDVENLSSNGDGTSDAAIAALDPSRVRYVDGTTEVADRIKLAHAAGKPLTAASIASQGIMPPSVPSGAIYAADILGVPEAPIVDRSSPLSRAVAAAGITPLAQDTGAAATSTAQNPAPPASMNIIGGVTNGATSRPTSPALDTGSASIASDNAAGSDTNGVLRHEATTGAGRDGMPGAVVANDAAGGVAPNGSDQQRHVGHPSEIVLPDNSALPAQWEVVDADQVTATLKEGKNQPRDRSRAASNAQVQGIANAPDYRRLSDSPVMDVGAPTLSQDGAIVGGNGRFEGVSQAYDNGTASEYLTKLKADAQAKGIDPALLDGMKKPVLVRRITQPFDTRALAVASNSGGSLQYSALEQAKIDGERMNGLGDIEVSDTGDVVMSGENMANVRRAMGGYTAAELGSLTDKDGLLSQEGIRRIKNAMLYKAYGNSPTLSRLVESADNDLRSVSGALVRAAGSVSAARSGMENTDADIAKDLIAAVEKLSQIKASGGTVKEYLAQHGLFGDEFTAEAAKILNFLNDNIRSQKKMADFIRSYYDTAASEDTRTASMFADAKTVTKQERIDHAIAKQQTATEATGTDRPTGVTGAQDQQQPESARSAAEGTGTRQQGEVTPEENPSLWWKGLTKEQRLEAIAKTGLDIKPIAVWNLVKNKAEILAARDPLLTSYTQADIAKREQAAQDTAATDRAAESRAVEHQRNQPLSLSTQIQERSEGKTSQSGMFTPDGRATVAAEQSAKADVDIQDALNDLGAIMRDLVGVQRIMPEDHAKLLPVLVRLFDAAFRKGYYDLREATRYVRKMLSEFAETAPYAKFLPVSLMDRAAKQAAAKMPDGFFENQGLFGQAAPKQEDKAEAEHVQDRMTNADNKHNPDNFVPPPLHTIVSAEVEKKAHDLIAKYKQAENKVTLDPEEVKIAEAAISPVLEKAEKNLPAFKESIVEIAHSAGMGQMIGNIKTMDRSVKKLLNTSDPKAARRYTTRDMFGKVLQVHAEENLRDTLRATIVVKSYDDVPAVMAEIKKHFELHPDQDRLKDRVANPTPEGYRDILMNVVLPDGLQAEIQINTPEMLAAKGVGHKLYEISTDSALQDEVRGEATKAQVELYGASYAASIESTLRMKSSSENSAAPGKLNPSLNLSQLPAENTSPLSAKYALPSGSTKYSDSLVKKNLVPSGNLSGNFISGSSNHTIAKNTSEVHNEGAGSGENTTQGAQHDNRKSGAGSTQVQSAETDGGAAIQRQSGSVHPGEGSGNIVANDLPGVSDSDTQRNEQGGRNAEDGDLQQRHAPRTGDHPVRATGIPAGRDIPAKSGLNYHFTDSDLDYKGGWITKARQNVEAVELVKKLDKEGRNATRAEQAILAKFIGWGASDIRNNIFDARLDEQLKALESYDEAIANIEARVKRGGGAYLNNSSYREYKPAFDVLQAKTPSINWYTAGNITKAMLDAAKPDQSVREWGKLRDRLKSVMTDDEWTTAARSTQYAHYTGKEVASEMWRAVDRLGFKGGALLEPGAGNGIFPGLMPSAMANNSIYTGIEYDALTGAILKHLQPDERILVESFIDSALPDNFYDVGMGNPPFSNTKVLSDPRYKKHGFALHDYFFAKTMDKVKPGGLLIFVTSRYTMDKQGDKARQYLAERADLLGAIRLPETAFKKNAGTEVVTDILFLRKKVPGEVFEGHGWMGLEKIKVKGGDHLINEYFAKHPDMVLGEGALESGQHGPQYTVLPNKDVPITELLAKAVDNLPRDVYRATTGTAAQAAQVREIDWNPKAKKEGNYYVNDNGKLMQVENRAGIPVTIKPKDEPMVKDFVRLRDAISQAQYDQLNDGAWEASLKVLQKEYKSFVKKHGNILQNTVTERKSTEINEDTGERIEVITPSRRFDLINKLADDPEHAKLFALESINDDTGEIKEGDILHKRVLEMRKEATISTPHDALLSVLNDIGRVDIPLIAQRIGLSETEAIEALGSSIYESPNGGFVMQDEYLSGNVKRKLKEAQEAAKSDKRFERNVEALMSAQPSPVSPADITTSLGMNWIPAEVYAQFLHEKAGVKANIDYNEHTGQWRVNAISGYGSVQATSDWGTPQRNAADILESGLTGRPIRITKTEGSGTEKKAVFDAASTEAANQKLKEMRQAFKDWMWQDSGRTDKLVALYNDKFNTIVTRSFDGRHLTLPGTTSTISVFDHVKRGAWRIIQTGNTYLAHAVGSGKTWQMVISAMEQKRLGLINKPMIVVPNHMLQQFAQEWLQLYPAARLMVADEKQFHTDNRRRFVARAAMSDLDGIIITHSAFKLLDIDPDFKQKMIQEQLDYMGAALNEVQDEEGEKPGSKSRNPRVRDIQNRIEKLEEKLKSSMNGEGKDKSVRFDEMGVDMLYVDEAHEYRKLEFTTARQVKGISSTGSERAFDLHMKTRWLEERHPGRSLVMASGTPITNTIAEIYSVQRFMAPQVLEERGLQDFDAWASMFGEEHTAIEADASGKYSPVTRFSRFVNVPELTQMFREFADVLTSDHLAEMLGDKRPRVKYGARTLVVTPQVDDYLAYKEELAARLKKSKEWKPSRDEPNNPDPVIKIIGDGRLAAIDMRFIDPSLPSDPNTKLNQMIDGVIRSYKKYSKFEYNDKTGKLEETKGAAQMVFSDLGFGVGVTETRGFNARAWMEKRLQDAGIPKSKIAFMSDYKKSDAKQQLFKDVNAGRVQILIGSSKNMGTGVNAQQRLRVLHHLDTPWFPADLEQREGRIVRQGNKNRRVRIYAYSAKDSYDSVMWQMLASKQRFINQALSGDSSVRTMDDISEVSQFEMATAMTAGDPRAIQLAGIKADIEKYQRLYRAHEETRMRMKESYALAGNTITVSERNLPETEKLAAKVQDLSGDRFTAKAGKQVFDKRKEWGEALLSKLGQYESSSKEGVEKVGELSGFPVEIIGTIDRNNDGKVLGYRVRLEMKVGEDGIILARDKGEDPVGLAIRANNALVTLARRPAELRQAISDAKSKRSALEDRLDAPFQFSGELASKTKEASDLEAAMVEDGKDKADSELVQKAKAFAEKHHGEIEQRRKFTNEPYITHPAGVVEILKTVPHTEEMLAAAWAHDTVEDTKATLDDVRAELGDKVADLVEQLTKPYDISKMTPDAQTIKLADITHNTLAAKYAPADFTRRYLPKKVAELELLKGGNQELWGKAKQAIEGDDAPLASVAKKADIGSYEVQPDTARNLPIDAATLVELRRAAAGIEAAERGITFTVNADGKAIVTGPARVKVPTRFQRFANEHGLTLVVQRADTKGGFSNSNTAMPLANREAGALYFGEIGDHLDRTGKTRFSKGAEPNATPQTVESVRQATAKLRASWHGFKQIRIVQSVKEIPNELYLRALRASRPIARDSEGIYDPMTRTVYLIAENIASPERAVWVAIHEVVGHGGVRMVDASVAEALDHAAKNGFVAKLARAIAEDRGETFDARTHTDEAIAELAAAIITGKQDAILERYGVKVPVGMRSNLMGMIRRVVDAVRNFMAKVMGKPVTEVSDGDVLGMLRQMKDAVEGKEQGYDTEGVSQGALASRSNYGYLLVSGKSSLEGDIADAAKKIAGGIASGTIGNVLVGRTPHVMTYFMGAPLPMAIDALVTRKVFLEKHAHKIVGMTPKMVVQAMYRPALIFKEGINTFNIITNILTKDGAVMVTVKTNGVFEGRPTAIITSIHPRTNGAIAEWIKNGKDSEGTPRTLVYADELQVPEVITGRLNPENTNPAFMGRDFVSALGEINTTGGFPAPATSPISDKLNIAKQGTPVNINYRGMATVSTKLQQYLTGKGEPKIKTRKDLQAWIDKHYHGEDDNKPLFSSAPAQQPTARSTGIPKNAALVADFRNDIPLKRNTDYKAAKAGDIDAAARLVQTAVKPDSIEAAKKAFGDDVIYTPVHAEEAAGRNKIPNALALHYAAETGGEVDDSIVQTNRAYHTGANAMERLLARAEFSGKVEAGRRYVLVDDVTTMGSTLADLASYIRSQGGEVVGSVVLVNAARDGMMLPATKTIRELEARHGQAIKQLFGIEPSALTSSESQYLIGFRTTDELRSRVIKARQERFDRLRAKGILSEGADSQAPVGDAPLASRPAQPSQEKQQPRILRMAKKASMEADTSVMDHVLGGKFIYKLVGWNRIVEPALDRLMERAGEFVPEKVKAGMVSDYGLSGEYIDRKAEMKAAEAAQNRKSAGLVEMLAALTRAESRVAYQWMQEKPDTSTEQALLERLPAESRETLGRLKKMVSDLGGEAVRLGQMSQEAYQRNNMAYLHRTYAKHVLNNEGAISKMLRARALRIKGNQYKGRGIFDEVRMDAVGGGGAFGRKLQQGQADKSLVGEKLIRFERRDDSTDAMDALPGMTKKPMGKLREVIYWPASQAVPAKFGDWVNAGTFEVRDTKGDKLVVWRDFTKDERERMGELDEVRYAVAQTLQMMAHDIEVGRFFEWTAKQYGKVKPEGKESTASESMLHSYGKDEWAQVPSTNIPGTQTKKYGALAGLYVPGPVWNDIRQTAGTRIEPFGYAHEKVLQFWKKAKTAWSPAVHMNNVMANFVMADWHDLRAIDLAEALKVWANSGKRVAKVKDWVGLDGSEAKRQQYEQIMQRFEDSGALGGMFLSNEALRNEIAKQLDSIKAELTGEQDAKNEMGRMAKVLHMVTMASMVPVKGVKATAEIMESAYQFEDAIFRLAAFIKAIRYGKSDIEAGRIARHAFLNYDINAPWIQAARHTFLPFVSFFYRALPMAVNTVKTKPWKVVKLMAFYSLLSALGSMMSGGDDDEERKLLPKEKQGRVWGVVPKMVRMPWNHDDGAPYYLDIRRWVPVGDIADMEMGSGMLPPWATPGGPLILLAEVLLMNKSMFTEKEIVQDTDTQTEKLEKRLDHLFKGMLPNVPLPNPLNLQTPASEINPLGLSQGSLQPYAWSGIERSILKKEGSIGEVRNTPAAIASAVGIKISAYPAQNMMAAKSIEQRKRLEEIKGEIKRIQRNYGNLAEPTNQERARLERDLARQQKKMEEIAAEP